MFECKSTKDLRPAAIISLPCLDYASVIISSGMIASRFENRAVNNNTPDSWTSLLDTPVIFPNFKFVDGSKRMFLCKGKIDSIESYRGENRLYVKWVENKKLTETRAIENRWLSLVSRIDDNLSLENKKIGSTLARHVESLEFVLGQSGLCQFVERSHDFVFIIDTKNRVISEVKQQISLSKIGFDSSNLNLVIRDLVRMNIEGGEAMADTYCCKISSEPEIGWPATVISGSLRVLKHWDYCDSPIRVALISPTEPNYLEAISFVNNMYMQRALPDLKLPVKLMLDKPASIDIQLMYL